MKILPLCVCLFALSFAGLSGQITEDKTSSQSPINDNTLGVTDPSTEKAPNATEETMHAFKEIKPESTAATNDKSQAEASNTDANEFSLTFIITILFTIVSFYWLHNRITR